MADENKRIVELVAAKATYEIGGGRVGLFGYENEAATLRIQIGASPTANVVYVARRNGAQTFTGLQTFTDGIQDPTLGVGLPMYASTSGRHATEAVAAFRTRIAALGVTGGTITGNLTVNGWIESDQGYRDAGGVTRISATGAGVFSQATVQDVAATHVMLGGSGGRVTGSGALTFDSAGQVLDVGDGLTSAAVVDINADAGGRSSLRFLRAGIARWTFQRFNSDFLLIAADSTGTTIDTPFSFVNASAGPMTFGGATNRPATFNGTVRANGGYLDGSGVTRISSTGAVVASQATVADLTPGNPMFASTGGRLATESASAFRSRIGIPNAGTNTITIVADASSTPPGSPVTGVPYLIGPSATGAWSGRADGDLGTWTGSAWTFATPAGKPTYYNTTTDKLLNQYAPIGGLFYGDTMAFHNVSTVGDMYVGYNIFGRYLSLFRAASGNWENVVGPRRVGWGVPTGTATRATFATGSVTLPQLAERLKALIDDLAAHGLIGT